MLKVNHSENSRIHSLFKPLDYNLAISSIMAGLSPSDIYANNPEKPVVALIVSKNHIFLAGSPQNGKFNQALHHLITQTIFMEKGAAGIDVFFLHTSSADWQPHIEEILAGWYPLQRSRTYLECTQLLQDWRESLAPGFGLLPVTADLLSQSHLENLDYLKEELCSERPSVEDFLDKSFGYCILKENQLAGWCLSEYNTGKRCEVGVATVDAFQRQGLGTVTTTALIEHALSHGYQHIGWHCWTPNTPSVALALRADFKKIREYPIYLCVMNLAIQFSLHGDDHRAAGKHQAALAWYEKATQVDTAPAWVYIKTAKYLTHLGENKLALQHISQAIQQGFDDFNQLRTQEHFAPLYSDPVWETFFE